MINNVKPSFSSIQTTFGSFVGTIAYNSTFAYNSSQIYGGYSGGIGPGPNNNMILTVKPNL